MRLATLYIYYCEQVALLYYFHFLSFPSPCSLLPHVPPHTPPTSTHPSHLYTPLPPLHIPLHLYTPLPPLHTPPTSTHPSHLYTPLPPLHTPPTSTHPSHLYTPLPPLHTTPTSTHPSYLYTPLPPLHTTSTSTHTSMLSDLKIPTSLNFQSSGRRGVAWTLGTTPPTLITCTACLQPVPTSCSRRSLQLLSGTKTTPGLSCTRRPYSMATCARRKPSSLGLVNSLLM